jgi:hypothetical protein
VVIYLSTERFSTTMRYFVRYYRQRMSHVIVPLTYEELFCEGAGPIGHYIFTDFDRLSRYELECAAAFANALNRAVPEARILNHPLKALERYSLLIALHRAGINDFTATRLEEGGRPPQYPVFIRAEDGYGGPETDLIYSDAEFDAAVENMIRLGLPRRGRIAIGFANERSPDGYFHKYGAFNIAGRIVPHDLMYSQNWVVKIRSSSTAWTAGRDSEYGSSPEGIANELRYIEGNPHTEILLRAFGIAGIDYGRADYGVVDGRVQIFEINTNPHLPWRDTPDNRAERRAIVDRGLLEAFEALNTPIRSSGRLAFSLPRPRAHNLHWPRRRLPASLARMVADFVTRR